MSNLTPTIIRFPEDELRRYKDLAQENSTSLAEFIRDTLKISTRGISAGGRTRKLVAKPVKGSWLFDLRKYRKWSTGKKNRDSVNHDKIIYREDWKEKR